MAPGTSCIGNMKRVTLKPIGELNRNQASQAGEALETTEISQPFIALQSQPEPSVALEPQSGTSIASQSQQPSITSQPQPKSPSMSEPQQELSVVAKFPHEPSSPETPRLEGIKIPVVDHDPAIHISTESTKILWDEAYDQVEKQNKTILRMYERMLAHDLRYLHGQTDRPPSSVDVGTTVPSGTFQVRRRRMEVLLDGWVNGGSEERDYQSMSPGYGDFIHLFCREVVMRSRERMSPAAIIPWVAACYASKALRQSAPGTHDVQANFIHVVSRMEWYDRLQTLFTGDEDNNPAYPKILKRMKDLYAAILLYFMRVAILYSPGFSYGFSQPPVFTDELNLDSVIEAERALAGFDEEQVNYTLQRLFETAPIQVEAPNKLLDGLPVTDPKSHLTGSDWIQNDMANEIYRVLESREKYTDFLDWEKPECQLLWISGDHGQGKTKLFHGIIQALYKPTDSPGVAFFFFSQSSLESNNAAAALRNLICLIITRCTALAQHLKDKLNTTGRKQFDHPNDFLALSALFFHIIQDEEFPKTYLIVDSLDECIYQKTEFINLIIESASVCSRIKWLVSGISNPGGSHSQHLSLSSDIHDSSTVMDNYIKEAVSVLARSNSYDTELEKLVTDSFCQLDVKNYLWVDIVCGVLKSKALGRVEDFVAQVETKRDLPGLYSLMHEIIDNQGEESRYCLDVLLAMGAIYQSLGIVELKKLLGWPRRVDLKAILYRCSGFLHLQGDTVLFRHESAREYAKRYILDPSKRSETHVKLTVLCLKSLGDSLANEYTALPNGTRDQQEVASTIASSYASLYWMQHLVQITDAAKNNEVQESVISFLKKEFLHWVDVLTLGDKIHLVVSQLRDADMYFRKMKQKNSDLANAMQDAHQFMRLHISTDGPNTLQALNTTIFSPEESLWAPTVNPWLCKQPKIDQTWIPNYTTFRGHNDSVRSIAISSDSQVLASGSDDGTVRIWDIETGTTQHVFDTRKGTYSYVTRVALASRIVAAGPDDLPVILLDTLTGRKVGELPAYTVGADALCLSPDGSKIAVAGRRKVYIWNIDELLEGNQAKEPIEYPIRALGLVFSRDNELLITSGDAIQLCDSNSFQVRQKFTNDQKDFTCAALSPHEISGRRLLASGSEDGSVCIWEIGANPEHVENAPTYTIKPPHITRPRSGEDEGALMITRLSQSDDDSSINSLTFSPDGSRLASSSYHAINIWETATRRHLNTLQARGLASPVILFDPMGGDYLISSGIDKGIHFWYVNDKHGEAFPSQGIVSPYSIDSLALHPENKMLAAVRSDHTVFLWDLQSGNLDPTNLDFGHSNDLRSLAFSPTKGDKLLSASDDRTAQVCDVVTGKRLHTFRHKDWVRSAAWSPDGRHVATASDDGSIRFWEIGNEVETDPIAILDGIHGGYYVMAVAFSPNGKYVISGGDDANLTVLEKVTEKDWRRKHKSLVGHTERVLCVLATPDSKYVLSASADGTLRGWDIESGREISNTNIDWIDFKMWWDLSGVPQGETPNYVMTPQGPCLHKLPTGMDSQTLSLYRIRCDKNTNQWWITCKDKDAILIPREYRPTSSLVVGTKVIIGSVLERVYILEFRQ
ncbi:WD40-repeat-containing domain protein [Nemania sp. FL0031]|nr:WD40-repeat-containing domain protein [Nemania sp. FL0031]